MVPTPSALVATCPSTRTFRNRYWTTSVSSLSAHPPRPAPHLLGQIHLNRSLDFGARTRLSFLLNRFSSELPRSFRETTALLVREAAKLNPQSFSVMSLETRTTKGILYSQQKEERFMRTECWTMIVSLAMASAATQISSSQILSETGSKPQSESSIAIVLKPFERRRWRGGRYLRYSGHHGLPKRPESIFVYFANSTSFSMLQAKVDSIPIA
jgi:hypothetical protein